MEKKRYTAIKPIIAENAAPVLLSSLVVSSAAYIYTGGSAAAVTLFTVVSAIYSAVLFGVYEKLRAIGKNWLTAVVVALIGTVAVFVASGITDFKNFNELTLWFMEPSRYNYIFYGNIYALVIGMGFILISCLYYFTKVLYRGVFVFLVCLCPFCLFAKTFTSIPVIYPILIMTLFFFIMMKRRADKDVTEPDPISLSAIAFVLTVTVIASFFPKLETAPYRELFDEFITGVSISAPGAADFNSFTDSASNATSSDKDTVVFMIYGDNPEYIKRQCFDLYSPDDNSWHYYGDSETGSSGWKKYVYFEDPTLFYKTSGTDESGLSDGSCLIQAADGKIRALYTPENIVSLKPYNSDKKIYRTELDEFFLENDRNSTVTSYAVEFKSVFVDNDFSDKFTDEYVKELYESKDDDLSRNAASYILAKKQAVQYNSYLLSDEVMDKCYSSKKAREEVKRLAENTAGIYPNDYYKAQAIVNYFRGGSYIYDKDFTAPNGYPDTFILGTKRGACASYATAMTLMCRELGMTARYCEGFLIQNFDPAGKYWYVTGADSHAFVQVWIDGYGWTVFDPTSFTEDGGFFDMTFVFVGAIAALAVAAGAAVLILRPRFAESRFVGRMKHTKGAQQYTLVYNRINRMINDMNGKRENTLTPTDTAAESLRLLDCDISGFISEHARTVYGGYDTDSDCSEVYGRFVKAYKAKQKEERKRRHKWRSSDRKK